MAGYLIADVDVTDGQGYQEYVKAVPSSVEAFGGKYLVRAGPYDKLEGDWTPKRLVVIEFESAERAKEWYNSTEYGPARDIRFRTAVSNVLIVEGV